MKWQIRSPEIHNNDIQTMFLLTVQNWTYYVIQNVTTTSKRKQ